MEVHQNTNLSCVGSSPAWGAMQTVAGQFQSTDVYIG